MAEYSAGFRFRTLSADGGTDVACSILWAADGGAKRICWGAWKAWAGPVRGSVSGRWRDFLRRYEIKAEGQGRKALYHQMPPVWLRLYGLNLPLDYAAVIGAEGEVRPEVEILQRQRERLSVIALIRDQFRGDPFAFMDRILELGRARGLRIEIKEPADPVNWENDEDFLMESENMLERFCSSKAIHAVTN